ncbi:MAG: preprotein translocase subunit YajC [Bacteroidales bacterium]|nr:preprotein translocase subunit YajC [Bacteroidales bacterium]
MILLDIPNVWKTMIMIVLMIAVFYIFLIRPQNEQAKKDKAYRDGLKKGDRVMTAGGIHATIVNVENAMATIEIAPSVRIKVQVTSIQPIPTTGQKK